MSVERTNIPEVLVLTPTRYRDERGFFAETFSQRVFERETGLRRLWCQDNQSLSVAGVVRGLHYQYPHPQGKLVRCDRGRIFDVAVDIRTDSPTYLGWIGVELSGDNGRQLWIPEGFAHGFLALSEAIVSYKTTAYYDPDGDRSLRWDDPDIGIVWPLDGLVPMLSRKDEDAPLVSGVQDFPSTSDFTGT